MDSKPTINRKDAVGVKKVPMSVLSTVAMEQAATVMLLGARKYGRHNYRETGVQSSIYYDAAMRHLHAWFEGQDNDPESGLSHLAHAIACCAILIDGFTYGNVYDDRPPKLPEGWRKKLDEIAGKIVEAIPEPHAPATEWAKKSRDYEPYEPITPIQLTDDC